MVDRYWELTGWLLTLSVALGVALATDKAFIYIPFFMLSALFLGIYLGKMIYAEDAVAHPDAFKSLTEKELDARRRKSR